MAIASAEASMSLPIPVTMATAQRSQCSHFGAASKFSLNGVRNHVQSNCGQNDVQCFCLVPNGIALQPLLCNVHFFHLCICYHSLTWHNFTDFMIRSLTYQYETYVRPNSSQRLQKHEDVFKSVVTCRVTCRNTKA